jgi:hypothetical protein
MEERMIFLWTFSNEMKMNKFIDVLKQNSIEYEIQSEISKTRGNTGNSIAVLDKDFDKAKKLLIRHRKRKTSADFS